MTLPPGYTPDSAAALPLHVVAKSGFAAWLATQPPAVQAWLAAQRFDAGAGSLQSWADAEGRVAGAVLGVEDALDPYAYAHAPRALPAGDWHAIGLPDADALRALQLGWGLGLYRFDRYKTGKPVPTRLAGDIDAEGLDLLAACVRVRDLVNTPTEHMGPDELEATARTIAQAHGAQLTVIAGDDLLAHNFPTIHAVGRASHRAPRLLELTWGEPTHPHIVLCGKGVCFDTGGLDLKAAVEIDNTDAEGRLVLCDALTRACELAPDLLLDFATLTGAARIALGPDLPALYANDDALADAWLRAGMQARDPLWRMPLWRPYLRYLTSGIADLANSSNTTMAGSVTAALYLERFVSEGTRWAHLDVYAWNDSDRPGRPAGGEAMGLRAAYALLKARATG